MPSFFIICGLLFFTLVSSSHDKIGLWIGISCFFLSWIISPYKKKDLSFSSLAFFLFIQIVFINLFIFNNNFIPFPYFLISSFMAGYIAFYQLEKDNLNDVFIAVLLLCCALAVWSCLQYFLSYGKINYQGEPGSAIFSNPNILGALLNIIMIPVICLYITKADYRSRTLFIAIIVLFSGLIATQSKGAFISFIVSFIFIYIFSRIKSGLVEKKSLLNLFLGLIVIAVTVILGKTLSLDNNSSLNKADSNVEIIRQEFEESISYTVHSSIEHRSNLARKAWEEIKVSPFIGSGFYSFIYFYYEHYNYAFTHYVHNDYLQLCLEIGLIGLFVFLCIGFLAFFQGIKILKSERIDDNDRVIVIAIMSSLVTLYVHGLFSYVFYTPLLVFIFSAYIAVFNTVITNEKYSNSIKPIYISFMSSSSKSLIWKLIISTFMLLFLFQFVFAQISFRAGQSMMQQGKVEQALMLYKWARTFSPSEVEYYLLEADYWKNRAVKNKEVGAADKANNLYQQVMEISKYDTQSRLNRAILHRLTEDTLSKPVSHEVRTSWLEQALQWKPHHHVVQGEYIRSIYESGHREKAKLLLLDYLKMYPDSKVLNKINYNLFLKGINT